MGGAVDMKAIPGHPPGSDCEAARTIPHLPAAKQGQLCAVARIIRATSDVERVVLYGSHARGDWVDDPVGGYLSDLDILVLVGSPALAEDEALWADCQDRAREVAGDTPVSLIVHTVDDVRQQLERGSSFFRDVMAEGAVLYDMGRIAITVPELTPAMHHALARESFQRYFEHAAQLYRSFERNLAHGSLAIAAFELHQVAETLCKAVLVVFTAYLPKMHDLDELGRRCSRVAPEIGPLVPADAPDRKCLAALLRAAYVDARYSFTFEISCEDLEALARYVSAFRARAEDACQEQLAELAAAARPVPTRRGYYGRVYGWRASLSTSVGACVAPKRRVRPASIPGHHGIMAVTFSRHRATWARVGAPSVTP
jgi:HEPN domain-containing protein